MGYGEKHLEVSRKETIEIKPGVYQEKRIWDKKDRCPFLTCAKDVTNFSRHLIRNHASEDTVKLLMKEPLGSKSRKSMIDSLRKEGNFTLLQEENKIRPKQRDGKHQKVNTAPQEFNICPDCKGIFRKESLWRHSRRCTMRTTNRNSVASEGQNVLIFQASMSSFGQKLRLRSEVLSKMRADSFAFYGKSDPVILQYAEDYLNKFPSYRVQIKNSVSNKIRTMGRLLKILRDSHGIMTMLDILEPTNYQKVLEAVRVMVGYNGKTQKMDAASLSLQMGTQLKHVCMAARTLLIKRDPILPVTDYSVKLKAIKEFRSLVEERWKFDMGSISLKNLNENKNRKVKNLPTTSDIIRFRTHLYNTANSAVKKLQNYPDDISSFKELSEAVLTLAILHNRKRQGDVQYLRFEDYDRNMTTTQQDEILQSLSDAEKILTKLVKRVTTEGKGEKSVPLLIPTDLQNFIRTMRSVRSNFVGDNNKYVFALAMKDRNRFIDGGYAMHKFANRCGAEHPETLTPTRLRKQIATVLQVLNLSENEKEQIATFMGHTKMTHEKYYRYLNFIIYELAVQLGYMFGKNARLWFYEVR